jgi:V8-like Glu-specific endopeptidase
MARRSRITVGLALACLTLAAVTARASATAGRPAASVAPRSPAVGALFTLTSRGKLGSHFCTATVVDSPKGDVVVTAAHCVSGRKATTLAFVPGYHNGSAPKGIWNVTRVLVDSRWANAADPDHDFAFLVVHRAGTSANVEALTGAERLSTVDPRGKRATVVGYPATADAAVTCTNMIVAFTPTQLEFDCDGYSNGTSGSALIVNRDPATGLGTIVGVIGGYQEGGISSSVSYAAAFQATVASLYRLAIESA